MTEKSWPHWNKAAASLFDGMAMAVHDYRIIARLMPEYISKVCHSKTALASKNNDNNRAYASNSIAGTIISGINFSIS